MKAEFKKTSAYSDKTGKYRKDHGFYKELSVLVPDKETMMRDAIIARFYCPGTVVYCVVWVNGDVQVSGAGKAGGCGYHKESAALEEALNDAGVYLSEQIGCAGETAMDKALKAIAEKMGYKQHCIHRANA